MPDFPTIAVRRTVDPGESLWALQPLETDQAGYIDVTGSWVIDRIFDDARPFVNNVGAVQVSAETGDFDFAGNWGLIDKNGRWVAEPRFFEVREHHGAPFPVAQPVKCDPGSCWSCTSDPRIQKERRYCEFGGFTKKWGFINGDGAWLVVPTLDDASAFSENLAHVTLNGRHGFVGIDGSWIIEPTFEETGDFTDGRAPAKLGGRWGYIDASGSWAAEPKFDFAWNFSDGVGLVFVKGKGSGYLDTAGNWLMEPVVETRYRFMGGFAMAGVAGKVGYVDTAGRWVIKPAFDDLIGRGSSELIAARIEDKWGYIDISGSWVIKPRFDRAKPFQDGLGEVHVGTKSGVVDPGGDYIVEPRFDEARIAGDLIRVALGRHSGYMNRNGKGLTFPFNQRPFVS